MAASEFESCDEALRFKLGIIDKGTVAMACDGSGDGSGAVAAAGVGRLSSSAAAYDVMGGVLAGTGPLQMI